MKHTNLVVMAGAFGALIAAADANANLTGLSMFMESVGGPGAPPAGGPRDIWRIYADFSDATDLLLAWGCGGSDFGAGSIQNLNAAGTGPGTGFTNIGGGLGNRAPLNPGTTRDWDTYATIGVLYGQEAPDSNDATSIIGSTPQFIPNGATSWTPNQAVGGGYFIYSTEPQGRADYRVSGNDTDHRVLLMQLVVNAGEHVAGTIGVAWKPAEGGPAEFGMSLVFNYIPGPGGLGLLACPGLLGARRRRQS